MSLCCAATFNRGGGCGRAARSAGGGRRAGGGGPPLRREPARRGRGLLPRGARRRAPLLRAGWPGRDRGRPGPSSTRAGRLGGGPGAGRVGGGGAAFVAGGRAWRPPRLERRLFPPPADVLARLAVRSREAAEPHESGTARRWSLFSRQSQPVSPVEPRELLAKYAEILDAIATPP